MCSKYEVWHTSLLDNAAAVSCMGGSLSECTITGVISDLQEGRQDSNLQLHGLVRSGSAKELGDRDCE